MGAGFSSRTPAVLHAETTTYTPGYLQDEGFTARAGRRSPSPNRVAPEKELRFKPRITALARQREPRGGAELGPIAGGPEHQSLAGAVMHG